MALSVVIVVAVLICIPLCILCCRKIHYRRSKYSPEKEHSCLFLSILNLDYSGYREFHNEVGSEGNKTSNILLS